MHIDRCVCFGEPFAHLKTVADATGSDSIAALQQHVAFGLRCERCHPYVRRMLATGETAFGEGIRDEATGGEARRV